VELVFLERAARAGEKPIPEFSLGGGIDDCADALVVHGVDFVTPVDEATRRGPPSTFSILTSLHQPGDAARRR